jgi:predicted TPR repeat methyltransferase
MSLARSSAAPDVPQDAFVRWAALQAWSTDATNRLDETTDLAFWDEIAATYDPGALAVRVPAILERVRGLVRPGATLLEIGAGTGAFALPLASRASRVTALDYSPAMLGVLRAKLGHPSAPSNISTVLARWEDAQVGPHDIVLAANALYRTADLRLALGKLIRLARERGIIVWSVGRQAAPRRAGRERVDPGYRPGPDYVHVVDGLYDLDVFAQVELIEVDDTPSDRPVELIEVDDTPGDRPVELIDVDDAPGDRVAVIWWDSR